MPKFSDSPLMWMERAATSKFGHFVAAALWNIVSMLALCELWLWYYSVGLFGVKRYGVHINGYTVSDSGEVSMWLARRSATKQTYPGLLDNLVSSSMRHKTVTQQLFSSDVMLRVGSPYDGTSYWCVPGAKCYKHRESGGNPPPPKLSLLPHWSAEWDCHSFMGCWTVCQSKTTLITANLTIQLLPGLTLWR